MMGSQVPGGEALTALLSVIANPTEYAKRLSDLAEMQVEYDKAKTVLIEEQKKAVAADEERRAKFDQLQADAYQKLNERERNVQAQEAALAKNIGTLDHDRAVLATKTTQLAMQKAAQDQRNAQLDTREKSVIVTETRLREEVTAFNESKAKTEAGFAARENALLLREREVAERTAALDAAEADYRQRLAKLRMLIGA